MGCDIHLRVEQRCKTDSCSNDSQEWDSCGFYGEFCSRVYGMFARMANVRSYGDSYKVQFKPRGLPEDISFFSKETFYLYVTSDESLSHESGYCLKTDAERWVNEGYSKWIEGDQGRVSHPDLHNHSWLTTKELRQCFDDCFKDENGSYYEDSYYIEWLGLVSLCEGIESDGVHECRVVFAFDN